MAGTQVNAGEFGKISPFFETVPVPGPLDYVNRAGLGVDISFYFCFFVFGNGGSQTNQQSSSLFCVNPASILLISFRHCLIVTALLAAETLLPLVIVAGMQCNRCHNFSFALFRRWISIHTLCRISSSLARSLVFPSHSPLSPNPSTESNLLQPETA